MRKMLFVLFAVAFVSSLCFAKQAPVSKVKVNVKTVKSAPVSNPVVEAVKYKTFTGIVDFVLVGVDRVTSSEIAVVDEKGQKSNFLVKHNTIISAKDGEAINLSEIKKDNKVAVQYKTYAGGGNKAVYIKLLE
ncbi:MAG: hypothetical protein KKB22_02130 [Candidatus Omnitrophica bacterium]|nr:hypothetical protein [Candidatus Omnitrophota bacterium]